jgi:hypothetical protein
MHGQTNSRSASVYHNEDTLSDNRIVGRTHDNWKIGEGTAEPTISSWTRYGQLGYWLWNTQRGWMVYVGFLIMFYGGSSLALLVMNRFILWSMLKLLFEKNLNHKLTLHQLEYISKHL